MFCRKLVAAGASVGQDADRQPGVALLGLEDVKRREWCWAKARDFRSAKEAGPEWWADDSLVLPRAKERLAQRQPDVQEWAAAGVQKVLARTDARRASWMRLVALLVGLDELGSVMQPPAAQQASRHAARRLEAQQKSMVMLAEPLQAQPMALAPQALPLAELSRAVGLLQEP